jgi:hypothetical protein
MEPVGEDRNFSERADEGTEKADTLAQAPEATSSVWINVSEHDSVAV